MRTCGPEPSAHRCSPSQYLVSRGRTLAESGPTAASAVRKCLGSRTSRPDEPLRQQIVVAHHGNVERSLEEADGQVSESEREELAAVAGEQHHPEPETGEEQPP